MWTYNHNNELYHHGIKGMKWGVRKDRSTISKKSKHIKYFDPDQVSKKQIKNRRKSLIDSTKEDIDYNNRTIKNLRELQKNMGKDAKLRKDSYGYWEFDQDHALDQRKQYDAMTKQIKDLSDNNKSLNNALKSYEKMSDREVANSIVSGRKWAVSLGVGAIAASALYAWANTK